MTVNSYLVNLASSLVLKDTEKDSINNSISTLERRIDSYFDNRVIEQNRFGSSTRRTILPRKADENSDIDYMIVFNTSETEYKPQTYLNYLKEFAEHFYSSSEIHQSHPTIVLELNHIKFDLVPAKKDCFSRYQIPSPSNYLFDWIDTDPWGYDQELIRRNEQHNYLIKPLIRLIKYWNSLNSHCFISFELEKFTANRTYLYINTLAEYFYEFWNSFSVLSSWSQTTQGKVNRAKNKASKIKQLESNGEYQTAESEIQEFLAEI